MTRKFSRLAAGLGAAAALATAATPAAARGVWGWGGSYHRDRVDAGDVIAGILILGTIAAVANAQQQRREDGRRAEPRGYPDAPDYAADRAPQWRGEGGIGAAIARCEDEVRAGGGQRPEIAEVVRAGDGWRINGQTGDGPFSCTVDGAGRLRNLSLPGDFD